jgi:hypothetical protein
MRTTFPWRPLGLTTLALGLAVSTGLACSKSSDPVTQAAGTTLATIGTQPTATELATKAAQPCSIEVVQPLASAKYPGIEVTDLICSNTAAVATLKGAGAPGGDGVGVLRRRVRRLGAQADGPAADASAAPGQRRHQPGRGLAGQAQPPVATTRTGQRRDPEARTPARSAARSTTTSCARPRPPPPRRPPRLPGHHGATAPQPPPTDPHIEAYDPPARPLLQADTPASVARSPARRFERHHGTGPGKRRRR